MEGLHAITCKAVNVGMFKGASIGQGNLNISRLFYADDAIFIGEWSQSNVYNVICMLRCFYLMNGIKINVHKSKLLGLCVSDDDILDMASVLSCGVSKLPLTYIGLPVECNMGRCENWKYIIQKFSSKMSQWKARLLSVGGRLSLIKSVVGNLPTYYMSLYLMPTTVQKVLESMRNKFFIGGNLDEKKVTWVKWNSCLASKAMGGLGIGSIYALNVSLLFKWIWRFRCHPNDLWAKVIKGIHGQHGGIGTGRIAKSNASPWNVIVRSVSQLQLKGIDLLASCNRSLGDGKSVVFWEEYWCGDRPLKELFPRVYALDRDKRCTVAQRVNIIDWNNVLRRNPRGGVESSQFDDMKALISNVELSDNKDGWKWALNSTGFSVASARKYVDEHILQGGLSSTRWNKSVPIKVNVFRWRLSMNKLPTMVNLDRKGIDVGSLLCPVCSEYVENGDHLFFSCGMAHDLWELLARWCDLDISGVSNFAEWISWLDACQMTKTSRYILGGIADTMLWSIWNFRNALLFSTSKPKKATFWDSIVYQSFLWISSRNPKLSFSWVGWLDNPIVNIASL